MAAGINRNILGYDTEDGTFDSGTSTLNRSYPPGSIGTTNVSGSTNYKQIIGHQKSPWIFPYGDPKDSLALLNHPRFTEQLPVRVAQMQTRRLWQEKLRKAEEKQNIYHAYTVTKTAVQMYARTSGIGKIIFRINLVSMKLLDNPERMINLFKEGRKEAKEIQSVLDKMPPALTQEEILRLKFRDRQKLELLNTVHNYNTEASAINLLYLKAMTVSANSQIRSDKLSNDQYGLNGRYSKAGDNQNGGATERLQRDFNPAINKWAENSNQAWVSFEIQQENYIRAVAYLTKMADSIKSGVYPDVGKLQHMTELLKKIREKMQNEDRKVDAVARQLR